MCVCEREKDAAKHSKHFFKLINVVKGKEIAHTCVFHTVHKMSSLSCIIYCIRKVCHSGHKALKMISRSEDYPCK